MKKEKIHNTVIRQDFLDDGENEYTYELLMQEGQKTVNYKIPLYSIRVNMKDSSGVTTSASVKEIFADAGKAINFYEKIVHGLATPIDLVYVAEDELH